MSDGVQENDTASAKEGSSFALLALAVCAGAGALAWTSVRAAGAAPGPAYVILAQIAWSAIFGAIAFAFRERRALAGAAALASGIVLIAGCYGAAILGPVLYFVPMLRKLSPASTTSSFEARRGRASFLTDALLDGRLRIEGASATPSMSEIFKRGSQSQKLAALNILAKRYTPAFGPALHIALADRDSAVRVLATAVLTHLDSGYANAAKDARARALADNASGALWRGAAEAYQVYAQSGLLKPQALRDAWDKALHAAKTSIHADADDGNPARLIAARSLLALKREEEAADIVRCAVSSLAPESDAWRLAARALRWNAGACEA